MKAISDGGSHHADVLEEESTAAPRAENGVGDPHALWAREYKAEDDESDPAEGDYEDEIDESSMDDTARMRLAVTQARDSTEVPKVKPPQTLHHPFWTGLFPTA